MKQCTECKEYKDEKDYYKCKTGKDGLTGQCKSCTIKIRNIRIDKNEQNRKNNKIIIKTKYCTLCKNTKGVEEFSKDRNKKDGISTHCKSCKKEYQKNNQEKIKQYFEENKERVLKVKRIYREKHKEKYKKIGKDYYANNKGKMSKLNKLNRLKNKDRIKEMGKKYYENNREKILKQTGNYNKNKLKNDPDFALINKFRCAIRSLFLRTSSPKNHSTEELLGTDFKTAIKHVNSLGYNRDIHDLDHIVPLSVFNVQSEIHQKVMFNYLNLRPELIYYNRWIKQNKLLPNWEETIFNIAKQIKVDPLPIIEYIESRNIKILYEEVLA